MIRAENQKAGTMELRRLISSMQQLRELRETRKRTPIRRFRAIVRAVMNNLKWLDEEEVEESEEDDAKKNILKALKRKRKTVDLLVHMKALLHKPLIYRTSEDKEKAFKMIGNLKCFEIYPEIIRKELAGISVHCYFEPNRVLVKEGHPSYAMYFILEGELKVEQLKYDVCENVLKNVVVGKLEGGDYFGYVCILHNIPRQLTVTTVTDTELLEITKYNFDAILKKFLTKKSQEIVSALRTLPYFDNWDEKLIRECCILGKFETAEYNTIVLSDTVGKKHCGYFLIDGECKVIQKMDVEVIRRVPEKKYKKCHEEVVKSVFPKSYTLRGITKEPPKKFFKPHIAGIISEKIMADLILNLPIERLSSKSVLEEGTENVHVETKFLQVAIFHPGQCFNIGETSKNRFVIVNSESAKILLLPLDYLKDHERHLCWKRIANFHDKRIPSDDLLFGKFLINRKWKKFRENYSCRVTEYCQKVNETKSWDIPYSIRCVEDVGHPFLDVCKTVKRKLQPAVNDDEKETKMKKRFGSESEISLMEASNTISGSSEFDVN